MAITQSQAETKLIALIEDNFSSVPIFYPNHAEVKPEDGKFGRLSTQGNPVTIDREVSAGGTIYKDWFATVQLFSPLGSGRLEVQGWAEELVYLLQDYYSDDSCLFVREVGWREIGIDEYKNYQINVEIPFFFITQG